MTLIKEMLDNLQRRDGQDDANHSNSENRNNRKNNFNKQRKHKNIFSQRIWLGALVMVSSFLILIAIFLIIHMSRDKVDATTMATQQTTAIASNNSKLPASGATTENYNTTTSNAVHQMYFVAINNLNEGKVEQALQNLKAILEEDPNFTPAKQTYNAIHTRYETSLNNE